MIDSRKKILFYSFLFFIWAVSVVFNASKPGTEIPKFVSHADKFLHFLYYFPAGYISASIFYYSGGSFLLGIIPTIIMGGVDEFIQSFTPGRYSDFFDLIADFFGALAGILLFRLKVGKNSDEKKEEEEEEKK